MLNPHLATAVFYLSLAAVATLGSGLISVQLLPEFAGLRWIRVHFITLGVLTQVLFVALPWLTARRVGRAWPRTRWDVWLLYNAGLIALLVGIPLVNKAMIIAGGTLVMLAVVALVWQVRGLARAGTVQCAISSRFYGAGLLYLLLGAFIGTGLWLNWATWLHLPAPKEVHVHSNLWGFGSLVLGGLLLDLKSRLAPGKGARSPKWATGAFLLMVLGALGLVLGPWLEIRALDAGGVAIHTVGTLVLLVSVARSLHAAGRLRTPGSLQLLTAYLWQLVAVAMAPLVVYARGTAVAGAIAGEGSLVLIYGWLLAFALALLPYLLESRLSPGREAKLWGTWLTLAAGHLATTLYTASLFLIDIRGLLQAAAFLLWGIAFWPVLMRSWRIVAAATARLEEIELEPASGPAALAGGNAG
jgi:cytochrome c oxidase cbb3-type subunit I